MSLKSDRHPDLRQLLGWPRHGQHKNLARSGNPSLSQRHQTLSGAFVFMFLCFVGGSCSSVQVRPPEPILTLLTTCFRVRKNLWGRG